MTAVIETPPKAEKALPVIKPETQSLADKIRDSFKVDTTTGDANPSRPIYVEAADQLGVTQDEIKRVKHLDITFAAATTLAVTQTAYAAMEANPELNVVTSNIPMHDKDFLNVAVSRSGQTRNPRTGEISTVPGPVRTEFHQTAGANRGQNAAVRAHLRVAAEASLGKKA